MPVRRPAAELNFGNEPRLDKDQPAPLFGCQSVCEGRSVRPQLLKRFVERLRRFLREAGSGAANVNKLAAAVVAERQGTDRVARRCRRGVAADNEFLAVGAFGLEPFAVAARAVRRVAALADDAFQPQAAGILNHGPAVSGHMLRVAQRRVAGGAQEPFERVLAVIERDIAKAVAVKIDKIEREQHRPRGLPAFGQRILQRGEARNAAFVFHHGLAI